MSPALFALALTVSEIYQFKIFHSKVGNGKECKFLNDTIRWQLSKSTNVISYMFDFRVDMSCANGRTQRRIIETDEPVCSVRTDGHSDA